MRGNGEKYEGEWKDNKPDGEGIKNINSIRNIFIC